MGVDKKDLLRLREKINDSKQQLSEAKGQRTQLLNQLKEEFNCNNSKQAEKLLEDTKKEIEVMQARLEKAFEVLITEFEHLEQLS